MLLIRIHLVKSTAIKREREKSVTLLQNMKHSLASGIFDKFHGWLIASHRRFNIDTMRPDKQPPKWFGRCINLECFCITFTCTLLSLAQFVTERSQPNLNCAPKFIERNARWAFLLHTKKTFNPLSIWIGDVLCSIVCVCERSAE